MPVSSWYYQLNCTAELCSLCILATEFEYCNPLATACRPLAKAIKIRASRSLCLIGLIKTEKLNWRAKESLNIAAARKKGKI